MKTFLDKDFLLNNEVAKTLFHKYAENQPIIDYHCHIDA
ncbi:MAG: glucuronate isomerase, partial [Lachnospiraceae bacterium]|nr:glucuronate isomerase [Lachnospiraceae bacterium]